MKNKLGDLKRLWDRASKTPKITSTSTPTPTSIEVESQVDDQNVSNPPSNEPEIDSPFVQHEESDDEAMYELEHDPGKRTPIINYDVNDQDHLAEKFEDVDKVVLKNAPKNCKMTSHDIQLELINCCAKETTSLIIKDLGGEYFAILADESSDVYQREELALCLRYVDKTGWPVERFLGIIHVEDTTSLTLKKAIEKLLMDHSLSFPMVRGQGYDGASNMKGKANGLKKLIMDESPSAYYVHCFAHQLQLTLVAVAKENGDCFWFFQQLSYLLNVLGMSCKKIQMFREAQADYLIVALQLGEIETGKGQNQEMGLGRPCETRWGSHSKTVSHVVFLYPSIQKVLKRIGKEYNSAEGIGAQTMLRAFESFEFVFMLHLLEELFGYTDDLSQAMQKRDQDIVNAIDLISLTKQQLLNLREESGWELFLQNVKSFCLKHKIKVLEMDAFYKPVQRSKKVLQECKESPSLPC